jgi:hypothetical protein
MDTTTRNLFSLVLIFSLFMKTIKDIKTLIIIIPRFLRAIFTPLSFWLYLFNLSLFVLTIISALIIPISLIRFVILHNQKRELNFMRFMIKPQLYCALFGIVQWILEILFNIF